MTEPARRIDRNSVISLGLAFVIASGAVTFALRVPSESTIQVIVSEGMKPIEDRLRAVELEIGIIKDRLNRKDGDGG